MRLIVLIAISALSTPAFAVCTVHSTLSSADYKTLDDAVNGPGACATVDMPILLLEDLKEDVTIARDMEIDGNGFTLEGTGTDTVLTLQLGDIRISNLAVTGGAGGLGGGLFVDQGADVVLDNVDVHHNSASFGGGIANRGDLTLNDSAVHDNSASGGGGGIAGIRGDLRPNIVATSLNVQDNSTDGPGGGILLYETLLDMEASAVQDNVAGGSGGGIYGASDTTNASETTNVAVRTSVIRRNDAGGSGGGVGIDEGPTTLWRTRVYHNTAVSKGGGLWYDCNATLMVGNSTISENSADEGGGAWVTGEDDLKLFQLVTIVDNQASDADQLFSSSEDLEMIGGAIGETVSSNAVDDCTVLGGGLVRATTSPDATCTTSHSSNRPGFALDLGGSNAVYTPVSSSVLVDLVAAAFCLSVDQAGASRVPTPCDGGALEH